MKYLITILALSALLFACGEEKQTTTKEMGMEKEKSHAEMSAHDAMAKGEVHGTDEKLIYYTCSMESHKHIHSREAGSCTECGMALVEGVVTSEDKMEYYGCPMLIHSHIRHDEPGRCAECKMELKPMRLKSSS